MRSEAAKVKELYERHALEWDEDRGRDLFERPWLDRFLSFVQPRCSILDVGCGSAEPIARLFIELGHKVSGVDSSPSLIGICKGRFPQQSWIVADMRELHLNSQFDAIIAWDSFFHLCPDDQRRMFPLFREHSSPNAVLMFTSGPGAGEIVGEYRGEPLYHGLDPTEYRELLDDNGFTVLADAQDDATCGHHTVWLAQLRLNSQ
jgi:SAM-dependent methyltransferase